MNHAWSLPIFVMSAFAFAEALFAQEQDAMRDAREAINSAIAGAVEAVEKNYQEFQDKNEEPLEKARTALVGKATSLNLAKKLKEATVVQEAINDLDKRVMSQAVPVVIAPRPQPKPVQPGGNNPKPPAQKSLAERMAGKWNRKDSPVNGTSASVARLLSD
ncbi:MAG: hypothetical protein WD060_04815, partial [Pirellulales bacterium]